MVWKLFSLLKTGDVLPVSDSNHHYNSNKNNHAWTIFHWPTSLCWCRFGIETANSPKLHPPLLCIEHPFCIGCSGSRLHCSLMWPQVQVPARGMWASSRKCSRFPISLPCWLSWEAVLNCLDRTDDNNTPGMLSNKTERARVPCDFRIRTLGWWLVLTAIAVSLEGR